MNPNGVALVRVFTREPNTAIAAVTHSITAGFEVVVEAKAGAAIHGYAAVFFTNIVIRDLTANDNITAVPAAGFGGSMHTHAWLSEDHQFVYAVPPTNLVGRENHLCQVLTFLRVGLANPDVSFTVSPWFILI